MPNRQLRPDTVRRKVEAEKKEQKMLQARQQQVSAVQPQQQVNQQVKVHEEQQQLIQQQSYPEQQVHQQEVQQVISQQEVQDPVVDQVFVQQPMRITEQQRAPEQGMYHNGLQQEEQKSSKDVVMNEMGHVHLSNKFSMDKIESLVKGIMNRDLKKK
mgnify:FL=1